MNYWLYVTATAVCACGLVIAGCSSSSSSGATATAPVDLSDATIVFEAKSKGIAGTGCYEFAGLVFCVVEQKVPRRRLAEARGRAPHIAVGLLRKSYPNLSSKLRLESNLVENTYDDEALLHRYVIAYRLADVAAAVEEESCP